jgi:hypothetical protein
MRFDQVLSISLMPAGLLHIESSSALCRISWLGLILLHQRGRCCYLSVSPLPACLQGSARFKHPPCRNRSPPACTRTSRSAHRAPPTNHHRALRVAHRAPRVSRLALEITMGCLVGPDWGCAGCGPDWLAGVVPS